MCESHCIKTEEKTLTCHVCLPGGSLTKVAYLSEVCHIRKRHFSFSSSKKNDDEDQDKVVNSKFVFHVK